LATAPRTSSLPNGGTALGAWKNAGMDPIAWLILGGFVALGAAGVALAPRLKRDNLQRQLRGGGGSLSGIGAGFDVVWRPSAEEARADWQAQVEMPAPAPAPGDKGRMDDGRIVLEVSDAGR